MRLTNPEGGGDRLMMLLDADAKISALCDFMVHPVLYLTKQRSNKEKGPQSKLNIPFPGPSVELP
jgi:hypothetical protein